MTDDGRLRDLAERLADELITAGERIAVVESCTGGWIAKTCTDIPGSSGWFECGWVAYSNAAKRAIGVSTEALRHGAVSEPVVRELVTGALGLTGADRVVAVSGIAGPDGGTADKPVGTVCFAWGDRDGTLLCETRWIGGDRDGVRRESVAVAIEGLLRG
jgi:nicotinamide-nucleotide amidase